MSKDTTSPLAIVGIGCALPDGISFATLKQRGTLNPGQFTHPFGWSVAFEPLKGGQVNTDDFDYKKFSIPPLFRKAVSRETRMAMLAAEEALSQLALDESLRDHCDQLCATHMASDSAYRNATKVAALRALAEQLGNQDNAQICIDEYKQTLASTFGATSHDRVGEMASTIPARIAHFAHTRGKCLTLDGGDLGGLRLLQAAQDNFRYQDSQLAVLTSIQCFHHQSQSEILQQQGISIQQPWLEGAISLVICPIALAQQQNWPILMELSTFVTCDSQQPQAGYFAGASQVFYQLLEMHLNGQDECSGAAALGQNWQISAAGKHSYVPASDDQVAITDYRPITALGNDKDRFWQTLADGQDVLRPQSAQQLNTQAFVRETPQKLSTYINKAMSFDSHSALDIALSKPMMPAKKARLDVSQLQLLKGAEALVLGEFKRPAVILACNLALSADRLLGAQALWAQLPDAPCYLPQPDAPEINRWSWYGATGLGGAKLLAQQLGLPDADCIAVEAACASSMAALHNAVRGLQSGRYDGIVVGGIETATLERDLVLCGAQMMLSATRIRPFAKGADGFTPGDGGGLFVLQTKSDAPHAIAHIDAISGSCDSRSMTAPDPQGQALAMYKTLQLASVNPEQVQYLETHGTGTTLGDQAELESLSAAYSREHDQPLYLGSGKYNFGHCFAGAGAISLAKMLAALEQCSMPPTPILGELNDALPFDSIPAQVPQTALPWPALPNQQRIGAINAFGTGGINYHLTLLHSHSEESV
ncbi:polyketide synthase [Pseudoalteromonas sp. R3]|uniref:beta-ketoacyl [acyl carrier protein] synthase domain-containing protein n=1 Tax=Pseudoalteromonas sp. R3 TaxID=1709477 RepID=UPI0006B47531|nr:polyketide synthase [Pseudoalteromonas sp. R3]AZZ97579.1 3-ketoacyl-ACP synthase [Pseudoalteromonas sp. R3]